jgi:hypothetical protein
MIVCYIGKITRMTPHAMFVVLRGGLKVQQKVLSLGKTRKNTKSRQKY